MLKDIKILREWFDIVSAAMAARPDSELALQDVRQYFVQTGEELNGRPYDETDFVQSDGLTRSLENVLPIFEKVGLIIVREDRNRFTKNLRLHIPEMVAKLSARGRCVASRTTWQRNAFLGAVVIAMKLISLFIRFRVAFVIIGGVSAISKIFFAWDDILIVAVAVGVGALAILTTLFLG